MAQHGHRPGCRSIGEVPVTKPRDTLIPADLPQIVPDAPRKKCARWCGRGCTQAEYETAKKAGAALAARLGATWKARVWENLGWHFSAVSLCGRLKVYDNGRRYFTACLGEKEFPGGRWAEDGSTPAKAVEAVLAVARKERDWIDECLRGLSA